MSFVPRNDEQIRVGTTPGLVAGATSFLFNGSGGGVPDYRGYEIVISELTGRGILVRDFDYSWDYNTGAFQLLIPLDYFHNATWYNVHFENPVTYPNPVTTTNLVNWSYFVRDIMIPNIDAGKVSSAPALSKLNLFIIKYESECLTEILGYPLYKILLNEASTRVTELIFGAEYTDCQDLVKKWKGLIRPSESISLIANYIYFYHQEYSKSHTSGTGTSIAKPEAAEAFTPIDKMTQAWNFYSQEVSEMVKFLWCKKIDGERVYPEFTQKQMCETLRVSRKIDSIFAL